MTDEKKTDLPYGLKVEKPIDKMDKAELLQELLYVRQHYDLGKEQYDELQRTCNDALSDVTSLSEEVDDLKPKLRAAEREAKEAKEAVDRIAGDRDWHKRQAAEQAGYIKALIDQQAPPLPKPMAYGRELSGDHGISNGYRGY